MKKSELWYSYPNHLVATEPRYPSRVLRIPNQENPKEITYTQLFDEIGSGDVFVINISRVMPRRLFSHEGHEILFVTSIDQNQRQWNVLFPAAKLKPGHSLSLPDGVKATLLGKGIPQIIETSTSLSDEYFHKFGELPLPPYIQKLRETRHMLPQDVRWYQPDWAEIEGSLAAPTASLHFRKEDLRMLENKGVLVLPLVLHVGLGTFLPIKNDELDQHEMHEEYVEIHQKTWNTIIEAKAHQKKIWALGTTVTRALESAAKNQLDKGPGGWRGWTKLFIRPGFHFQITDRILTNFHQPESTLLALVASLQGVERMRQAYEFAIQQKFRLFSYGDLSVWDVNSNNG